MAYVNEDGLWVMSNRDLATTNDKGVEAVGDYRVMKFEVIGTELGTAYAYRPTDPFVPMKAYIKDVKVIVKEAFAGGNLQVGTYAPTGAVIDADGLVTPTNGAAASLTAGAVITGTGAQVGTTVNNAAHNRFYVGINRTGAAITAGKATVVVEYIYVGDE